MPARRKRPLEDFFSPSVVAVIGATETPHSVGRTVVENLASFPGAVHLVNPKRDTVLGKKASPSIGAVREQVDLAVVVTPAATVPAIIRECAAAQVGVAIVISAGFKEAGARGVALEQEIRQARGSMRIIGPNCLGLMAPHAGLNATFAGAMARPGSIGFLSQSGALCTSILDWSLREMIGFSAFVSTGSMLDVGWGDLIDHLADDPATKAILMYMESIGDARSFLSAAREAALSKPIILIKAGRSEQAARAAASHTGALTGSDEVLDAALRRCGVLRVRRISDLFYMADVLARQPRPQGPRLLIVTNAGGPGVLATDSLITEGGELAQISAETIAQLDRILPAHWSRNNPIDILGDASPDRYAQALEIAARDPGADGLLVTLSPQGMTDAAEVAERILPYAHVKSKPVLASWMGGASVEHGEQILKAGGIPAFAFPDSAARAFVYMWQYTENLRALYETPEGSEIAVERETVATILEAGRAAGRTLLTEVESKRLLAAYGVPVTNTQLATTREEATRFAGTIDGSVVLKLYSHSITHKTDVGGVELDLRGEDAVGAAWDRIQHAVSAEHFEGVTVQPMIRASGGYELILGSSTDAQFGPVLLFGAGGQLVEIFGDRSLGLPPLNSTLARRMMERTKIYKALGGVRGRKPVDLAALELLLVRFSQVVSETPRIREIDINPLLVSADTMVALDARVVLHDWNIAHRDLPRTAIRPYPAAYVKQVTLKDGTSVRIRPIRPEDEPAMVGFHESLSERSVYFRYFHHMRLDQRVAHERLTRICFIDYDREVVLVGETSEGSIIAAARLSKEPGSADGEFAILVADAWQTHGLGTILLQTLVDIARKEGLRRVSGMILSENRAMQEICRELGFQLGYSPEEGLVEASLMFD